MHDLQLYYGGKRYIYPHLPGFISRVTRSNHPGVDKDVKILQQMSHVSTHNTLNWDYVTTNAPDQPPSPPQKNQDIGEVPRFRLVQHLVHPVGSCPLPHPHPPKISTP